ncbi:MAG TPA: hypothetical protein VFN87_20645 [Solirubrobacteraceae bacterium]|nr:hypothetical protein [Solirubrobacteraceae bacterium]
MSIDAAIGRIDQILNLQQQVTDPASLAGSTAASTSGGASLTAAGTGSGPSTDFASALASAQGLTGPSSAVSAASTIDPAAAALGVSSLPGSTGLASSGLTDASGLLGSTGLTGSTGLPGTTGLAGATGAGSATGLLGTSGLVGSTAGLGGVTSATGASSQVQAMTNMADSLVGKPYVWGGGHSGWGSQPGYDCSGFVSAVLHAGGYLSSPADTQTLPTQPGIQNGPGQYVTIYDRTDAGSADHVIIDINGQFYESGGESGSWGGGGGVAKIATPPASYLSTFNLVLHPAGL